MQLGDSLLTDLSGSQVLEPDKATEQLTSSLSLSYTRQWEVTLYKLHDQIWTEEGKGYCSGVLDNDDRVALHVSREPMANQGNDDEDVENSMMLRLHIIDNTHYQKVGNSVLMWSKGNSHEKNLVTALTFTKARDCSSFCEFLMHTINQIGTHDIRMMSFSNTNRLTEGDDDDDDDGDLSAEQLDSKLLVPFLGAESDDEQLSMLEQTSNNESDGIGPLLLSEIPVPTLQNLMEVSYQIMSIMQRETVLDLDELFTNIGFMNGLINCFDTSEQEKKQWELQRIGEIMFSIIQGCSVDSLEKMADPWLLDKVLGMLEYNCNEDLSVKSYREVLSEQDTINSAIPIQDDSVRHMIRLNYWLRFVLDSGLNERDELSARLREYIQGHLQVYIQSSEELAKTLEDLYGERESAADNELIKRQRHGVIFFHSLVELINDHTYEGSQLRFSKHMEKGLYDMIKFSLSDAEDATQFRGIKLFLGLLHDDGSQFRYDSEGNYNESGLELLVTTMQRSSLAVQLEVVETFRKLLQTNNNNSMFPVGHADLSFAVLPWNNSKSSEMMQFEEQFYRMSAPRLYEPLIRETTRTSKGSAMVDKALFENVCDLFILSLEEHELGPIQRFVAEHKLWQRLAHVISDKNRLKSEKLACIRCVRQAITTVENTEFKLDIAKSGIMQSIMDILVSVRTQDTLLRSACLAVLSALETHQHREGDARLIESVVKSHRTQMENELGQMSLMASLIHCYDNPAIVEPAPEVAQRTNSSLTEVDPVSEVNVPVEDKDTDTDEEEDTKPQLKRSSNSNHASRKKLRSNELVSNDND